LSYLRAKIIRCEGGEPEWRDVQDKEGAIKLMDTFCFHGWYRLNFYENGKLLTAVRGNPTDCGAPLVFALVQGEVA
jgi:hypothetical protein